MVRFSEIEQFPDFLEVFSGYFRTICRSLYSLREFRNFWLIWKAPFLSPHQEEDKQLNSQNGFKSSLESAPTFPTCKKIHAPYWLDTTVMQLSSGEGSGRAQPIERDRSRRSRSILVAKRVSLSFRSRLLVSELDDSDDFRQTLSI